VTDFSLPPLPVTLGLVLTGVMVGAVFTLYWLDRKDTPRPPRYTVVPPRDGFRASPERR